MEAFLREVEDYLSEHPDTRELLEGFNISREEYERYIALVSPAAPESFSMSTSEGPYNAEVSGLSS